MSTLTVSPTQYALTVTENGLGIVSVGTQGPTGATGATGAQGPAGSDGAGVPAGGAAGTLLRKNSATDYDTVWFDLFNGTSTWTATQTFGAGIVAAGVDATGSSVSCSSLDAADSVNCGGPVTATLFSGDGSGLTNLPVDLLSPLAAAEISITGATTATLGRMHNCQGGAGDYTVTLPAAAGNAGRLVGFRMNFGTNRLVTLDAGAGVAIDGQQTRVMWAQETALLLCDGSNWFKLAGKTRPMLCTMTRNAAANAGNGGPNQVLLDATAFDNTARMADTANNRVTIRRPGSYDVRGSIQWSNVVTTAGRVQSIVHKNGVLQYNGEIWANVGGYPISLASDRMDSLAAGDLLTLYTYQSTGVTQALYTNDRGVRLVVEEVPSW